MLRVSWAGLPSLATVGSACALAGALVVFLVSWAGLRSAVADDGVSGESGGSAFRCC